MEATKENIKTLEKELNEPQPLTDEECGKMDDLIGLDLSDAQEFQVLYVDKEFTECEAIALYPEYMVIRQRQLHKNKLHCETMAMEVEHENTHDTSDHILRESITSICIQREMSCHCDDCLTKIAKGEKEKQSDDYYIHIASGVRPHHFMTFGDIEYTRWLQEHLMNWRLKKGDFKYKKGVYHKGKNNG